MSARSRWAASVTRSGAVWLRLSAVGNLFLLRRKPRDAAARGRHARWGHLGPRDFLDLARRTGSVIDHHALTEPQADDVLLAPDMLGLGECRCDQRREQHGGYDGTIHGHERSVGR